MNDLLEFMSEADPTRFRLRIETSMGTLASDPERFERLCWFTYDGRRIVRFLPDGIVKLERHGEICDYRYGAGDPAWTHFS